MKGTDGKLLKKTGAYFGQVWREEGETKGRGSLKKATGFFLEI